MDRLVQAHLFACHLGSNPPAPQLLCCSICHYLARTSRLAAKLGDQGAMSTVLSVVLVSFPKPWLLKTVDIIYLLCYLWVGNSSRGQQRELSIVLSLLVFKASFRGQSYFTHNFVLEGSVLINLDGILREVIHVDLASSHYRNWIFVSRVLSHWEGTVSVLTTWPWESCSVTSATSFRQGSHKGPHGFKGKELRPSIQGAFLRQVDGTFIGVNICRKYNPWRQHRETTCSLHPPTLE